MGKEELTKIAKKLYKDPKIQEALRGILAPLQQKGDSLTIGTEDDKVEIKFEDIHPPK